MTFYTQYINQSSINLNIGSYNYALAMIKAGFPIASTVLTGTTSNTLYIYTGVIERTMINRT
jgi:hypothetical protein